MLWEIALGCGDLATRPIVKEAERYQPIAGKLLALQDLAGVRVFGPALPGAPLLILPQPRHRRQGFELRSEFQEVWLEDARRLVYAERRAAGSVSGRRREGQKL